jgi:LPS-assembly protein
MRILILSFLVVFTVNDLCLPSVAAQTGSVTTPSNISRQDRLKIIPNEPLTISAESLEKDVETGLYIMEGDVDIKYRDVRLRADRVELNEETGDMVAIGDVVYAEGGDVLRAERLEFNINSELGIVYKGDAVIQPDQYITGERIEKIGEKSFKIDHGSFTACSSFLPFWKFKSSQATIHKGDYFIGRNILLFIQGIPILFTPYLIFPIKEERQTGFLVPDIGSSRSKGFHLGNTFFWAINDSQDLSLTHNFYDIRGHELELDYRYIYSENTRGSFLGRVVRDRVENSDRGDLRFNHRQTLPLDFETLANVNLVSDRTFLRDFDNSFEERTRQSLTSDISFTKRLGQNNLVRILFDRLENVVPANVTPSSIAQQTDYRLPEIRFSSFNQRLFNSPIFFQQDTVFSSIRRDVNEKTQLEFSRLDINPAVSIPLKTLGRALTLTPKLSYRETLYTDDIVTAANPDLKSNPVDRGQFGFSLDLSGPRFDRIFDRGEDKSITKIKHLIEPSLTYSFIQNTDQTNLPSFDSIDRISQQNQLTYALTNRLLARKKIKPKDEETGTLTTSAATPSTSDSESKPQFETKEFVSLQLSQSVNFTQPDFRLSNIVGTLQVFPGSSNRLQFTASYDVYVNAFVGSGVDLYTNYKDKFNLAVLWRRNLVVDRVANSIVNETQFLDFQAGVKLWNTLGIQYRTRFNIEDQDRVEDTLQLAYNGQCWNLISEFTQQDIATGTITSDRRFIITLEFKHLGRIGSLRF